MGAHRIAAGLGAGVLVTGRCPPATRRTRQRAGPAGDRPTPRDGARRRASSPTSRSPTRRPTRSPSATGDRRRDGRASRRPSRSARSASRATPRRPPWPGPGRSSSREWSYATTSTLRRSTTTWQVVWSPTVVEPCLREDEVLDATTIQPPSRGEILGAGGQALVTDRPVVRFGIDRVPDRCGRGRRRVGAGARGAGRHRRGAVRQAGRAPPATRRSSRRSSSARTRCRPRSLRGLRRDPGVARARGRASRWRRPGSSRRRSSAGSARSPPRWSRSRRTATRPATSAGLSGLQARYDEQLARHARRRGRRGRPDGNASRELFREDAGGRGRRSRPPSTSTCRRRPSGCWPASVRPARWSRSGRRPATSWPPPAAPAPTATTWRPTASTRPARPSRCVSALALLRDGADARQPVVPCPAHDRGGRQGVQELRRLPGRRARPHPAAHRASRTRATPRFIAQRDRLGDEDLADAAAALGLGVDHDLGFPAYFGSVDAAGVGDRDGRRH